MCQNATDESACAVIRKSLSFQVTGLGATVVRTPLHYWFTASRFRAGRLAMVVMLTTFLFNNIPALQG